MLSHPQPCSCNECNGPGLCAYQGCHYCGGHHRPECADCHGPVDDHEVDDDVLIAMGIECGAIRPKVLILNLNKRSSDNFGRSQPDRQGLSAAGGAL
jgi:hypothetical protein